MDLELDLHTRSDTISHQKTGPFRHVLANHDGDAASRSASLLESLRGETIAETVSDLLISLRGTALPSDDPATTQKVIEQSTIPVIRSGFDTTGFIQLGIAIEAHPHVTSRQMIAYYSLRITDSSTHADVNVDMIIGLMRQRIDIEKTKLLEDQDTNILQIKDQLTRKKIASIKTANRTRIQQIETKQALDRRREQLRHQEERQSQFLTLCREKYEELKPYLPDSANTLDTIDTNSKTGVTQYVKGIVQILQNGLGAQAVEHFRIGTSTQDETRVKRWVQDAIGEPLYDLFFAVMTYDAIEATDKKRLLQARLLPDLNDSERLLHESAWHHITISAHDCLNTIDTAIPDTSLKLQLAKAILQHPLNRAHMQLTAALLGHHGWPMPNRVSDVVYEAFASFSDPQSDTTLVNMVVNELMEAYVTREALIGTKDTNQLTRFLNNAFNQAHRSLGSIGDLRISRTIDSIIYGLYQPPNPLFKQSKRMNLIREQFCLMVMEYHATNVNYHAAEYILTSPFARASLSTDAFADRLIQIATTVQQNNVMELAKVLQNEDLYKSVTRVLKSPDTPEATKGKLHAAFTAMAPQQREVIARHLASPDVYTRILAPDYEEKLNALCIL